jgi:anti-sigma B factor antagonist
MDIGVEYLGPVVRLVPHGRIDSASSPALAERMDEVVAEGCRRLVVDFHDVRYITSAGFRALLVGDALMRDAGGRLALCCLPADVQRLFDLAAFNDDFTITASLEACVVQLQQP